MKCTLLKMMPTFGMGIQMIFSSRNTLRKSLTKVKGKRGMMDVKGVEYQTPCAECSATYVGETRKMLRVQMAKQRLVKNKNSKNGNIIYIQVTVHAINPWEGGQAGKKKGS